MENRILKYEIKFLDYWHLGSGLSGGAKLDSLVLKDNDGLPFVSGKTLKGLFREMAEEINCKFVNCCFGGSSNPKDICYDKEQSNIEGVCYFSNATINQNARAEILYHNLKNNLFVEIASTKIGKNGVAVDNSLREIEVVIPITLYGEIRDIPLEYIEQMKQSTKMVKRMGLNRNRGLGRCEISIREVI